jgi:hypothetical protein
MLVGFTQQEFNATGRSHEFDGAMPWIMFHWQFKAVVEQNICTAL